MTMKILTEKEFSKHVGSRFRARLGEREIDLTLREVKGYKPNPTEQSGMERFSVFFDGPPDSLLPQQSFELQHEHMGAFDIFLVPISGDEKGFRYEAVFNYFN
jgi:uncharacterized protein DUF6916